MNVSDADDLVEGVCVDVDNRGLRVLLLRAETLTGQSYENKLRKAGCSVTVISSPGAAFAAISSLQPDLVVFDPLAEFGYAGSVQRLCASFDGPIVATGLDADSPMADRLQILGISMFAPDAAELLKIARRVPASNVNDRTTDPTSEQPAPPESTAPVTVADDHSARAEPESAPAPGKRFSGQRHWAVAGLATTAVALVIAAVFVLLPASTEGDEPVAKALPVIPGILLKPLNPLTIEELSGDTLPLNIAGITDRTVIDAPAVAFWGDTAPDAFVTVNGEYVEVSDYGAFVVDLPLEDGTNFIEVLASDFQGRTSRVSFTVVRTQ